MPGKVVDASVLGAAMFHEARAQEAEDLIGNDDLYEPALLPFELTNIALKKIRFHAEPREDVLELLEDALRVGFQWVEVDHPEVLRLALETGLTPYDASYLFVARLLDAPLVTFDEQLRSAAESTGV